MTMAMDDPGAAREARPGPLKGLVFLLVIVIVLAGLGAFAVSLRSQEGPKVARSEPDPVSVKTRPVTLQAAFQLSETYSGLATPRRSSALGFTASGRISVLRADVGDRVGRGDLLARLDTRGLHADLAAANAAIDEALAAQRLAEATVNRQKTLNARGHVSGQVVDEAVAEAERAAARLQSALARAEALRVRIDLAGITAPFAGVITERHVDEGMIAAPGQAVFELVETARMEARIGVPAAVAEIMEEGRRYELLGDGVSVPATLRKVTGVIDARARTVQTVFDLAGEDGVQAGMVLRLALDRSIEERGSWVPVAALRESARGLWSVMIAAPGDTAGTWTARARLVEVVHVTGPRAYVRGALDGGDRVIIDGLERITPGQPVAPSPVTARARLGPGDTAQ